MASKFKDKQRDAEDLFFRDYSQKRIAEILGVAESTVSDWVTKFGWGEKRASRSSVKKSSEDRILKLIDYQLLAMEQRAEIHLATLEGDGEFALPSLDKGQIDSLSKLFSGIKGKELTFAKKVEVITEFFDLVQSKDLDLGKQLVPLVDAYFAQIRDAA